MVLCSFPFSIINTNNNNGVFCNRQFSHSNAVRIQEEKVLGTRSPWGLLLLEMGSLPDSANYLYRKDKINGLFV